MKKRNFKTVLAVLMSLALVVNMLLPQTIISAEAFEPFAGGNGTEQNPYQIATAQQLQNLSSLVNDDATTTAYYGAYYELTDDIDMKDVTDWTPIGISDVGISTEFIGNFNGNNHAIKNLTVNDATTYAGIFGVMIGATIKNLGVVDCNLSGEAFVGGIAGLIYAGDTVTTIENCYVDGTIKAKDMFAGGIAGAVFSSFKNSEDVVIKNCYTMGDVIVEGGVNGGRAGGIIGVVADQVDNLNFDLSYCYSTANVSGSDYVAGILGNTFTTTNSAISIKNCMALNESITVTSTGSALTYGRIVSEEHKQMTFASLSSEDGQVVLNGNRGLQNMTANIYDFSSWSNDATDSDGEAVRKIEVNTATFWTDTANWYENGWNGFAFENDKLPGFGAAIQAPLYLQLNSDFTPPTVINVAPANGQTGVTSAGSIVITFSEAMNENVDGTVTLNGVPITGAGAWSDVDLDLDKETYTIPYADLATDTEFNITISGFEDLEGNLMYSNSDYSFFTVSGSDSVPPTVESVSPIDAQENVVTNGDLVITFSEKMNTSFGTVLLNGVTLNKANGIWTNDGTVYTIPYANLSNKTGYNIKITAFKDLAGNLMSDNTNYTFETAAVGADVVKPSVINVTPANGAISVSTGSSGDMSEAYIVINFSEKMNTVTPGAIKLNGVTLPTIDNSDPMNIRTLGAFESNEVTYRIYYKDLSPNTKYTITIEDFKDVVGNKMVSNSLYSFTTADIGSDTIRPTIKKVTPNTDSVVAPNGNVIVKFSEEMDTSVGSIYVGGTLLNGVGTWSLDKTTYTIPYKGLTEGQAYSIVFKDFKDTSGNVIDSLSMPQSGYNFYVAQAGAPKVLNVVVSRDIGPSGTLTSGVIEIEFDQAMNPTVAIGEVHLNGVKIPRLVLGTAVDGWINNNTTYQIGFHSLSFDTTYNISIKAFRNTLNTEMALNSDYNFVTSEDTEEPEVIKTSPYIDEIGIPTNGEIVFEFDENMDTTSLGVIELTDLTNSGNILLSNGVWSNEGKVYTVTYRGLLQDTDYQASIFGFRDLSGNIMVASATQFKTTDSYDVIKPTISNIIPENGATGIEIDALNNYIQITFSEPMEAYDSNTDDIFETYPGKIILNNVTLNRLDEDIAVDGNFGWDGKNITYKIPIPKLAYGTEYTIIVKDFKDFSGNKMEEATYTFKTVSEIDNKKPKASIPINTTTSAAISGSIVINFSEEMDKNTLGRVSLNGNSIDLTSGTWNDDDTTFIVSYPSLLNETDYKVNVSGFKDLAGNSMVAITDSDNCTFRTVKAGYDIYKPTVTLVNPKENAEGIDVKGSIRVVFSEKMNTTVGKVYLNGTALSGTDSWSSNNTVYSIDYSGLTKDKVYNVSIQGFKDVTGNTMDNYSYKFTAISKDTIKPTILSTIPANNGEDVSVSGDLVINFSEGMRTVDENGDPVGVISWKNGFEIQDGVWSNGNSTITIPYDVLSGREYTIVVDGFKDKAGNVMDSTYEFTFSTESLLVESLEFSSKSETLVSGDVNYATKGGFAISFKDTMKSDVGSVKIIELPITDASNPIDLTGTWSNNYKTYTVSYDKLKNDASYSIILEDFEDEFSNKMKQYKDEFTIGAKPVISSVTPLDNATDMPIAGNIVVTFDKVMDKTTKGVVKLGETTLNSANASWSENGKVYTIAYSNLLNSTDYAITIEGFKDSILSVVDTNTDNSFTTASKPVVNSVTPSNNASEIAIAGNIVVVFDRVMDKTTSGTVKLGTTTLNAANSSWSLDGKTYTIAYSNILNSTNYAITVEGFKDSIGSTMNKNSANSFTTASKPVINSILPSNNANSIAISGDVSITFDKVMDKTISGIVKLGTITLNAANGSWSLDGKTYTIAYSNISNGTKYTVTVEGFKDSIGSIMDKNNVNSFSTISSSSGGTGGSGGSGGSSSSGDVVITDNTYYVVSFNNNYDGSVDNTQTVLFDTKIAKPSNPTRTGYVFGGWYTEQSCKNVYNFDAKVTTPISLYAKWTVKTKTPTVDKKVGTYVNSVKVTLTCATKDAKIYYTLDGTKPTTSSKYVLSGKTVTISKTSTLRFMANANGNSSTEGTKTKYTIKTSSIATTAVPKSSTGAKDRKITLKAPSNTTLYYTVGTTSADKTSAPTTSSKSVKAGKTVQITISKNTFVKVIAVKTGCSKSDVVTRTYKVK